MFRRLIAIAVLLAPSAAIAQQQAAPAWTYGEHPLWGLSAHVTAGPHSVGLRCLPPQTADGPMVAVDVTPGLVSHEADGPTLNYRFEGGNKGLGSYGLDKKAGYFEGTGTACVLNFEDFRKARTFILDEGGEKPKTVFGRIPLAGAKAAIGKLMAACPAIGRDLENCGL